MTKDERAVAKNRKKWRSAACSSKRFYQSEADAMAFALVQIELQGKPLFYYKCRFCSGWHLTSKMGGDSRSPFKEEAMSDQETT